MHLLDVGALSLVNINELHVRVTDVKYKLSSKIGYYCLPVLVKNSDCRNYFLVHSDMVQEQEER